MNSAEVQAFQRIVRAYYKKHGRHDLPWRQTRDPYKILVSEVMLQQTQVERVKPFYEAFLKKFPTARRLAEAPLSDVLKAWQGLGYNRRAKLLHAAAKEIAKHGMPKTSVKKTAYNNGRGMIYHTPSDGALAAALERLPGVGKYTACAVAVFAFGTEDVLVETNIRTAVMHHFFPNGRKRKIRNTSIYGSVSDTEIENVLTRARPLRGRAREWNYALMDYGAFLKRSGVKLNAKSKHYTKQSKFAGSLREARGAILKELTKGAATPVRLQGLLGDDRTEQLVHALRALCAEGFVARRGARYVLAG